MAHYNNDNLVYFKIAIIEINASSSHITFYKAFLGLVFAILVILVVLII